MTSPFVFESIEPPPQAEFTSLDDAGIPENPGPLKPFPEPVLTLTQEVKDKLRGWLDQQIDSMTSSQATKMKDFADIEEAYRALPEAPKTYPYVGASNEVVPAIAMAVDPIHARLDIGIFKQDPVFRVKALRRSFIALMPSVEQWIQYYQKHMLRLREIASPRILECCKLGTMVFKVTFERDYRTFQAYNDDNTEVVTKSELMFQGPKVKGISLGDFLFPPNYQNVQDCPIVAERIRTTYWSLKVLEKSGAIANVDDIKGQGVHDRTDLERSREVSVNHSTGIMSPDDIIIHEVWCDYDINGDDLPERLVIHYHKPTGTFLSLRYNWYFHQQKPYVVIPYTVTNESLLGIGIGEMALPFQKALTKWNQMAQDNAYLANLRMFIAKRGSTVAEERPKFYGGKFIFADDVSDVKPFPMADTYQSTLAERQNLWGLLEKRTGISDYLTGRESPVVGSRATATSTLALIQEGTKRVEEVLENFRVGFAKIMEYCFYIWIQYGLGDIDDIVFSGDKVHNDIKMFFNQLNKRNVNGAVAIDLAATDASSNRSIMQQMQLQIIQTMMTYLDKVLQSGQTAIMAARSGIPEYVPVVTETMAAARRMFTDLLVKYDIRNPEDYLPALEGYLNALTTGQPTGAGVVPPGAGGPQALGGVGNSVEAPAGSPGAGPAPTREPDGGVGESRVLSLLERAYSGPAGSAGRGA